MYSNAKAEALIRDLSDRLTVRLENNAGINTISQGFYTQTLADGNTAQWPYLMLSHGGNVAEGQPVVYIQLSNVDAVSKDIFGNSTYSYSPTVLMLGYELSGAAGTNPIPVHSDLATISFEAQTIGAEWQLIELANGTAVTGANVNAATPLVDIQPLYWPTKSV
jgi:hypothetical protein